MDKLIYEEQNIELIKRMAEHIPGGFFIYSADAGTNMLYVNKSLLDIFGCESLEEFKTLTGFTFKGMVHPDDFLEVEKSIKKQISESEDALDYVEYRVIRKDGSIRWLDDYGHLADTPEYGKVYYVFVSDVTERHNEHEENLRQAEVIKGLSADFNSIYLLDLDTGNMHPYRLQSKYFNEIIAQLPNADGEIKDYREILPMYADKYVIPEDREVYIKEINEDRIRMRLAEENSYTVEYRCMDNGKKIYMQMSIVKIDGGTLGNCAVLGYREITEQFLRIKRETTEKIRIENELEKEKQANEIKSSFLFNMSHDIRTPMNAIMGFTALAKKHIDDPELLKDHLDKVEESSRHMLALIDDLLEMSNIDFGRIQLKEELCDISEQLAFVIAMHKPKADEKNITIDIDAKLPEIEVYADTLRFRRIMDNLIDNAVKFTPNGGKVEISAKRTNVSESGYARLEFSVSDSGIGMSEEFIEHAFDAFEREETSTKTGYSGTGLGLAIAKSLVNVMGGTISVKSKKGEGSNFMVSLPFKTAAAENTDAECSNVSAADIFDGAQKDGSRILLVEDIDINRILAETVLSEAGFEVEAVPDGCDAVDAVKRSPEGYYDLILMDIQMPVMNGYEATRAIRALNRSDAGKMPIIALSANARDEDRKMSLESGMNSHIAKPFDVAHLITTINNSIAQRYS